MSSAHPTQFSSRADWGLPRNRISLLLDRKRRSGEAILDLTESNPTRVGLPYPLEEILAALASPASLTYEPHPLGLPAAREAVARSYGVAGVQVDPEDVFLTASTSEAYAWLFKLLANPEDEILVPRPSYPLFEFLTRLESVRPIPYPLRYDGTWSIDLAALTEEAGPRTRAMIVVSPNNPTGSFLKREELAALTSLCRERGMALIGDEVFAAYPVGVDPRRAESVLEGEGILCFSLGGLSKMGGLPQLKLGWGVIGGPADLRRDARERLDLIGDTFLSVNAPVQIALPRLLDLAGGIREEITLRIRRNRETLEAALGPDSPCRLLPLEGGWSAVVQVPSVRSEEEWVLSLLEEDGVLVHPGYFFDFPSPAYLVLSLLPREDLFRAGVERIQARAGFGENPGRA